MKRPTILILALCLGVYFFLNLQSTNAQNTAGADSVSTAAVLSRILNARADGSDRVVTTDQLSTNVFQLPPTQPATGLVIVPTFDGSITGNANGAAIEAMINQAIAIIESNYHIHTISIFQHPA